MTAAPGTGIFSAGILYTPAYGATLDVEFGAVDANGTQWYLSDVDEGWGSPPVVGQVAQRQGAHGGFATPQFYGPRVFNVTVTAVAQTWALRDTARAALEQAFPVSDLALWRLDEPIPKQLYVRRSGQVMEKPLSTVHCEFGIALVAPDPRKYSTVLQTATAAQGPGAAGIAPPWTPPITLPAGAPPMSVSCSNNGNFETEPTVTITGPITGPAVVNQTTGQIVSYSTLALATGDVLVVDFHAQQAFLNGAFRPGDASSSWWTMQPGTTGIRVTGTASTGATMTVAWRDAWT